MGSQIQPSPPHADVTTTTWGARGDTPRSNVIVKEADECLDPTVPERGRRQTGLRSRDLNDVAAHSTSQEKKNQDQVKPAVHSVREMPPKSLAAPPAPSQAIHSPFQSASPLHKSQFVHDAFHVK